MATEDRAAVLAESVSKKFCRTLKRSMLYGVKDILRNMAGVRTRSASLRPGEFWALDQVSFELERGSSLGIIGANGSGKSTLLKLLNGIYMPDVGRIGINGRVAALIELGAGFHPLLTGRENIFINAAILGMSRAEVRRQFDDIAEFADIGDFLDAPVKHYSSGMYARLGFAVAAHVDPDVLLVDEVLAVGDADFRSKSYARMLAFRQQGKAVVLVSHDMMSIQAVCDRVIWVDHGRLVMSGTPEDVIPRYYAHEDERGLTRPDARVDDDEETREFVVTKMETLDGAGTPTREFRYRAPFSIRLSFETRSTVTEPYVIVAVKSALGGNLFGLNLATDGGSPDRVSGKGTMTVRYEGLPLYPGLYSIVVQVRKDPAVNYFSPRVMGHFSVVSGAVEYGHTGRYREVYIHGGGVPPLVVPYELDWAMDEGACVVDQASSTSPTVLPSRESA